jgi:hypothetical protein
VLPGTNSATIDEVTSGFSRVTLSGTPADGETWTIAVDGVDYNYTVSVDETLEDVVVGLAEKINNEAGYAVRIEASDRMAIYKVDLEMRVDYNSADADKGGELNIRGTVIGTSALIEGDSENDRFPLDVDYLHGVIGPITLHGFGGSDLYEIDLKGTGSALFNVEDKTPAGDLGSDRLMIYATEQDDFFLFRPDSISAIQVDENREPLPGGAAERVNYDEHINAGVLVFGRDGDDTFVFDGTSSPITVYGDAGDDEFQIGQVFKSPRDASNPDNGLSPEDYFPTTLTTRGYLSDGIGAPATLYGGVGNDSFNVYRNPYELYLYGEEDNDSFRIRAFVKVDPNDPKAPFININGGQGADFISYTVNAPVRIEGGDGLDTLTVVGTEFGDDFIVTGDGIIGAGLYVSYSGIEQTVVDGAEGNDTFFIASTNENVDTQLYGGLGSDTFNVAGGTGDEAIYVVGNSLLGHSGLISQSVSSTDPDYDGLFIQDVSANVADNNDAGVLIEMKDGPIRVFEDEDAATDFRNYLVVASYTVMLTRSPEEEVRVTASPALPRESEMAAGGEGILLNDQAEGVTLLFDRNNWYEAQTITITAPNDSLAEGIRDVVIQHSVIQGADSSDGGAYDGVSVMGVVAEVVDDDAANVLVAQTQDNTVVAEDASLIASDTYSVVLTRAPLGDVDVAVTIPDGQTGTAGTGTLTFTSTDWNKPQVVTVTATPDTESEGTHYSRIQHDITSDLSLFYGLNTADVARGLEATVKKDIFSDYEADLSGDTVTITGPDFTLSKQGGLTVTNKVESTDHYETVNVALSGTPSAGDVWNLDLDGTTYGYTAQDGDLMTDVASGLKAVISSDYTVELENTTLTVRSADAAAFTAELTGSGTVTGTKALTEAEIQVTGPVGAGETWTVTVNGKDYAYTSGDNGENTDLPFVDTLIADDDTAGVLVTQSNGLTVVTEPTDYVTMGSGQVISAGADDQFIGTFGTSVVHETDFHNSIYNAQSLDAVKWGTTVDTDVADDTVPHIKIKGTGDGEPDFYAFTITDEMITSAGVGGVGALFDIDHGYESGDKIEWASTLKLYDSDGDLISPTRSWTAPDWGSSTYYDDYYVHTFDTAGTYYIEVKSYWPWYWDATKPPHLFFSGNGLPDGADYELNISLEHHTVSDFQFSPEPILEDETEISIPFISRMPCFTPSHRMCSMTFRISLTPTTPPPTSFWTTTMAFPWVMYGP